jgi:hypothetical protein
MSQLKPEHDGTCAYLQPEDPRAEFEAQCAALNERQDYAALPPIDIAMEHGQFAKFDDLSDEQCFNDRFVEPQWQCAASLVAQMGGGAVSLSVVLLFVVAPIFDGEIRWGYLWVLLGTCLFAWFFIALAGSGESIRTRFNRQAQLVHVYDGDALINLPWRDVVPFVELGSDYRLRLLFPNPYLQMAYRKESIIRSAYRYGYEISREFDSGDHVFMGEALERLEFIRRYMEDGIQAVHADEDNVRSGLARKPEGRYRASTRPSMSGPLERLVFRRIDTLCYWLSFGPLINRWLEHKASQFRWPDEVERLCAPGADLSAYDTRPVKSRANVYYRYEGMDKGIVFVDKNGRRLH